MPEPGINPSRQRLEKDLVAGDFESGADAGLWRLIGLKWPFLTVAVTAGDGNELGMRIAVDGYPATAPGGQPWDLIAGVPLPVARWPAGGAAAQIFRPDWSVSNSNAPYMACDRAGLAGHDWAGKHPERAWNPGRTIAFYLREVHHELRGATMPQPPAESAA